MKKLFRNTNRFKLFTLLSVLVFTSHAMAAGSTVAVVNSIMGRAFVSIDGRTKSLKQGDEIAAFSEIFTEVGAQITISDYYDHKYHLAGSGHLQLLNKTVELKEGYLWVQSFQDNYTFGIQTANALANFKRGEAIVSFDSFSGRSQILVKQGVWSYSNLFNQMLQETVTEGKFSFIHMEQDNGTPRIPTPIGYQSFQQVTALFQNIDSKQVPTTHVQRNIASHSVVEPIEMQPQEKVAPVPTLDPSVKKELIELYKEKLVNKKPAKKWTPSYQTKTDVAVRVFGTPKKTIQKAEKPAPVKKTRAPASIIPTKSADEPKADAFESKLREEYQNQMRHSAETNKLINELKSFKQDYVQGF